MRAWSEKHIRELVRQWYNGKGGSESGGNDITKYKVIANSYLWHGHGVGIDLSISQVQFVPSDTFISGFCVLGELVATGDFPDTTTNEQLYVALFSTGDFTRFTTDGRDSNGNRYTFKLGVDGSYIRPTPEITDMTDTRLPFKYVKCDGQIIDTRTGGITTSTLAATGTFKINGADLAESTQLQTISIHGLPACHEIRTPVLIGN